LVVVVKLSATLLEMLYPIEACVLNLRRKTLLYPITPYVSYKHPRNVNATDVLLERGGQKPDTAISQLLMCLLRVYPEVRISASLSVKEEVAKRRMVQTKRPGLICRDI
jgi:hypothetical protein